MPADLRDPNYWLVRAEEARSIAQNLLDHEHAREMMWRIADDYERIAYMMERQRERERKP
jgi:hypothetical protein